MNLKAIQLGLHSCRYFCEQSNKPTFYITAGEFLCKQEPLRFSKTNQLHRVRIILAYPFVLDFINKNNFAQFRKSLHDLSQCQKRDIKLNFAVTVTNESDRRQFLQ